MKKKVLYRLPRDIFDEDQKKVASKSLEVHYVDSERDFHHSEGVVKKVLLEEDGKKKDGKEYIAVHGFAFLDLFRQLKRKAQIITLKDIGAIIANAGLNRESVVLDAGVGSGSVSCFIAGFVKRVDSFDICDENIDVAFKNVSFLGLTNVNIAKKDIYDAAGFDSGLYDAFILDVPEPWRAVNTADRVLKTGGFLVVYCPNISQSQSVISKLPESLLHVKTIEIIEREWSVGEKVLRPVTKDFGHTAFLSFVRKIY